MASEIERLPGRPAHAAGTRLRRRPDDGVWLLEGNGRYLQLSPAALAIWRLCDGRHDWGQIAARYREDFGVDGTAAIQAFANLLHERGFFAAPEGCKTTGVPRGPASTATEAYVSWSPEVAVEKLYAALRPAFRPQAMAALAALALGGAVVYVMSPRTMRAAGFWEQCALVLAILVSIAIHEAGHALTLRHFGPAVRRAGFGWYWFAPVAFVDTSAAYTLARGKRIAVSLAGPFASLFVAGCASILAALAPAQSVAAVAWSLAGFTYVTMLWNLNPLLELDGYYVLADLLQRPNLRRDAADAVCGRRRDRVALSYAIGALAYGALLLFVSIPSVARATIVAWLPAMAGAPIRLAVPLVATVAACIAVAYSHRALVLRTLDSWRSLVEQRFHTARGA